VSDAVHDSLPVQGRGSDAVHGSVRLGINTPLEIPVHRQELYEKMQNEEVPMAIV